jgi:hypothetical protein
MARDVYALLVAPRHDLASLLLSRGVKGSRFVPGRVAVGHGARCNERQGCPL